MEGSIKPVGIIIAGGQSRRFNQENERQSDHLDKFLAPFGGTTLLDYIIIRAQKQISPLWLNLNGDKRRVNFCAIDVFADEEENFGPLGGIYTAMKRAGDHGYSHIITFSGDSPFFPGDYVSRLCQAVRNQKEQIAICQSGAGNKDDSSGQLHPVMGLFPVSLTDDLLAYLKSGERRVLWWIRQHYFEKVVWEECNPDPFFNINNRQDLALAEKYLAEISKN